MKIVYTKSWYKIFLILFLLGITILEVRKLLFPSSFRKELIPHFLTIIHIVSVSLIVFLWYCIIKSSIKIRQTIKIFVYFNLFPIVASLLLYPIRNSMIYNRTAEYPGTRLAFGIIPDYLYFILFLIAYLVILLNVKIIKTINDDIEYNNFV
jgi:hypothetical protein